MCNDGLLSSLVQDAGKEQPRVVFIYMRGRLYAFTQGSTIVMMNRRIGMVKIPYMIWSDVPSHVRLINLIGRISR